MKSKLLLSFAFFGSVFIASSQNEPLLTSDSNGKIFFSSQNATDLPIQNTFRNNAALDLDWSGSDYNVSNHQTVDSWDPRLAVGSDGSAHVVYNDNHTNGLQKIMYRRRDINGDWTNKIFVDAGGEIGGRNNHFPSIAVSPNGDLHVSYNVWAFENVRNYVGYSHYNAATQTWSDGVKISDLNGTVNHTSGRHAIYSTANNLPVVVWGYDYRENLTNEEIYLSYFDGATWSTDMAVSDITDGLNAGFPHIESMGNGTAMIVYSELIPGNSLALNYRIYDETTHTLSVPKTIPVTNVSGLQYTLLQDGNGDMRVLTMHTEESPIRAAFTVFKYNAGADEFEMIDTTEISSAAGNIKRIDMDCNGDNDCGIVYTDFLANSNTFLEYNDTDGFSVPLVINNENPAFDPPSCEFDADGNIHVVWNDKRFDDGSGFDEREVIYEMGFNGIILGTNEFNQDKLLVYPNPSKGIINIKTNDSYNLEIIDLFGRIIDTKQISGDTIIQDLTASGTYFLRFTNNETSFVHKLIVE